MESLISPEYSYKSPPLQTWVELGRNRPRYLPMQCPSGALPKFLVIRQILRCTHIARNDRPGWHVHV